MREKDRDREKVPGTVLAKTMQENADLRIKAM